MIGFSYATSHNRAAVSTFRQRFLTAVHKIAPFPAAWRNAMKIRKVVSPSWRNLWTADDSLAGVQPGGGGLWGDGGGGGGWWGDNILFIIYEICS